MASTPLAVTFSRLSRSAFSTSVLPEIESTAAPLTAQTEHPRRDANCDTGGQRVRRSASELG